MLRVLLSLLVPVVLIATPARAGDGSKAARGTDSATVEAGSRHRCVCAYRRSVKLVRNTHARRYYRGVGTVALYPIGFDPLPYRFGYFPQPYRYHDRIAVVTVRPARYYR